MSNKLETFHKGLTAETQKNYIINGNTEEWKRIAVYSDYEISTHGRVRSFQRNWNGRMMKQVTNHRGYRMIGLRSALHKQRHISIHLLVLAAFVGPRPSREMEGAHLDGDKDNNHIANLKWVTRKENQSHRKLHGTQIEGSDCHLSVINEDMVKTLIETAQRGKELTFKHLGKQFGLSQDIVRDIFQKVTWKHVTCNYDIDAIREKHFKLTRRVLTMEEAREIRMLYVPYKMSTPKLAKMYNTHQSVIHNIITHKLYREAS